MQKLRTAMVRPGQDRLHGSVEVDEAYVSVIEHGVVSGAGLIPFVTAADESGTEVRTDGWRGYCGLSNVSLPEVHSGASLLKR